MAELASCTIYIKGVPAETTEADIRDACSQYGNITDVAIPEGKDFCFVEFAEEAQAQVRSFRPELVAGRPFLLFDTKRNILKLRLGARKISKVCHQISSDIFFPFFSILLYYFFPTKYLLQR